MHITLKLCCRDVDLRHATAVKGLARRNVLGAGAQVLPLISSMLIAPVRQPIQSMRKIACAHRCNDGWRGALLLARAWLQAVPNMQQQGKLLALQTHWSCHLDSRLVHAMQWLLLLACCVLSGHCCPAPVCYFVHRLYGLCIPKRYNDNAVLHIITGVNGSNLPHTLPSVSSCP